MIFSVNHAIGEGHKDKLIQCLIRFRERVNIARAVDLVGLDAFLVCTENSDSDVVVMESTEMMLPTRWTGAKCLTIGVFSLHCNIWHRILTLDASASRPAQRYGSCTRAGFIR